MPPYPTDAKAKLYRRFLAAVDALDAAGRDPDRWEEECLAYALGAMACGMYLVAEVELEAFDRPVAERSADAVATLALKPQRFSKDMLRHGLAYVREHYASDRAGTDLPPAVAAGRRDFQASLLS